MWNIHVEITFKTGQIVATIQQRDTYHFSLLLWLVLSFLVDP